MSWWGTLAGGAFGYMLGGPLGAVLGAVLGRKFDRGVSGDFERPEELPQGHRFRVQAAFFTAVFSVVGHLSKADGRVTKDEIRAVTSIMDDMELSAEQREAARALFNEGKAPGFDLATVLAQFRKEIGRRAGLQRMFMEILCFAAAADGVVHAAETRLLRRVCDDIGFARSELDAILAAVTAELHHRRSGERISPDDAYAVLGVPATATDAEVKKAYRRLLSRHHPDKLAAQGLPDEMMKTAAQRTHEIRQAYERIKESRGF